MAIVPQGNLGTNNSVSASSRGAAYVDSPVVVSLSDNFNLIENLQESMVTALLDLDPSECVDGDCPTFEIPVIMIGHNAPVDYLKNELGFTQPSARLASYPHLYYEKLSGLISQVNDILSGEYSKVTGEDNSSYISGHSFYSSEDYPGAIKVKGTGDYYTKFTSLGFYTGAKIFDEGLGKIVDEFIRFVDYKQVFPNIKFILPKKIKSKHFLKGFHIDRHSKYNVDIEKFYNEVLQQELPIAFSKEYLYFPDESPGFIDLDLSKFNSLYAQKSNFISRMIDPSVTEVTNFSSLGESVEGIRVPFLTDTFLFGSFSYPYLSNFKFDNFSNNTQYSSGNVFSVKHQEGRIGGRSDGANANTYIHEFAHAFIGTYHSWTLPTFSGIPFLVKNAEHQDLSSHIEINAQSVLGTLNRKPGQGIVFPETYSGISTPEIGETIISGEEDLYTPNMFLGGHVLKPPFLYSEENPTFKLYKNLYEEANTAHQDFEDKVASGEITIGSAYENIFYEGSNVKTYRVREALLERKNILFNEYQSTPEYITGEFHDIPDEEKEYVEFYINRYISTLTNNFTKLFKFTNGSSTGEVAATINDVTYDKLGDKVLLSAHVYSGLQSFWGGSYVLNNPPVIGSEFEDPINGVLYKIINIKEQRYATVIKALPESITIDEAQAVINSQSDSLWRFPTETELDSLSRIAYEGYEGGDATTMTVKVKIELELDFYPGAAFVAYEDDIKRYIFNVSGDSPSNPFVDITNTDESFYQANLFMVKDIDLLEDDTISTSFVVNPTNDDGTRKGPDVTSRIPFCKLDNSGQPTTEYDITWYANINSYNPAYPPYPDNTKVKDLFNEEYCPCLYAQQSFFNGSATPFTYTIIEEGSTFDSLQQLHKDLGLQAPGYFYDYILARFNFPTPIPDSFTTEEDITNLHAPFLYRYNDSEKTLLELAPPIGYYGFGYNTVLPNVYNINFKEYYKLLKSSDSNEDFWENCPDEFLPIKGNSGYYISPVNLRISSERFESPEYNRTFRNGTRTITSRYLLGTQTNNVGDAYNPLQKYYEDITSTGPIRSPHNSLNTGDRNKDKVYLKELGAPPKRDYHKDLYGEYNPLDMWHVLHYPSASAGIGSPLSFSTAESKKLNYLFNSNQLFSLAYRTIAEESATPEANAAAIEIGNVVKLNGDNYLIFSIKNNVVINQGMQSGNISNEVLAVKISEGIEGSLLDIYSYNDPFNQDAYNSGDYDFISYGVSLQQMQNDYNFLSNASDSNHHYEKLKTAINAHPLEFNTTSSIWKLESAYHTGLHYNRLVYNDYDKSYSYQTADQWRDNKYRGVKNDHFSPTLTLGRIDDTASLLSEIESYKDNITSSSLNTLYNNSRGFIFRRFFSANVGLETPSQKYYIKDVMESVAEEIAAYDTGSQIGGCTDSSAINFNPEATYNDGSCVEVISGCTQSWADNYLPSANTDDGSCQATICLNTDAAGEWGYGYNQSLINTINLYSENAILPAEGSLVVGINDALGSTVCQFLVQKRAAIMKVVCLNMSSELTSFVCNDNEVVRVIKDLDTNSISSYSSNPTAVDINLKDLIEEVLVIGVRPNDGAKININTYPFADGVSQYDIEANRDYAGDSHYQSLFLRIMEEEVFLINTSGPSVGNFMGDTDKHIKYNCVENPILPDGSGGCLLYSFESQEGPAEYRLQGCVIPEVESKTPEDCFNETLLESGYIYNPDAISGDVTFIEGSCKGNEVKYIVPEIMSGYTSADPTIVLSTTTRDLLPLYSENQIDAQLGYPLNILRGNQFPAGVEGSSIEDPDVSDVSQVLQLINPNFLFTEDGVSYTGPYKYRIVSGTKVYYIHEESNPFVGGGANTLKRLFTRNELLDNGIANSEVELTANNFNEIVNEINNLTIFTDN